MGFALITFLPLHCFCKAPYSKRKTTKAVSAKPSPETPKITESSTDSSVTTKPSLKTKPATADVVTVTPSKEYRPGSKKAHKDKKARNDKDDERSVTMIAVISGVAAVGCLVLGFLCLWFIIVQRRKSRYGVKSTLKLWTTSYDGNLTTIKAKKKYRRLTETSSCCYRLIPSPIWFYWRHKSFKSVYQFSHDFTAAKHFCCVKAPVPPPPRPRGKSFLLFQ